MDIIDDIENIAEASAEIITKKITEIRKKISKIKKIISNLSQINQKSTDYSEIVNSNYRTIKSQCEKLYENNGSNISKSLVSYIDNMNIERRNKNTNAINNVITIVSNGKMTLNKEISKLSKAIEKLLSSLNTTIM